MVRKSSDDIKIWYHISLPINDEPSESHTYTSNPEIKCDLIN